MTDPSDVARSAAAAAAAELVEPGMTIGLGSGRAVWKLVAPARRAQRPDPGRDRLEPHRRSWPREAGIEVVELDGEVELDLALDGADEVDPDLGLIKGGGGALLREKIVISAARRFVVVAETPKRVERLGEGFRLPVEVVRFAWRDTRRRLAAAAPGRPSCGRRATRAARISPTRATSSSTARSTAASDPHELAERLKRGAGRGRARPVPGDGRARAARHARGGARSRCSAAPPR